MDPKLLFPLKDWLYGFLPDHKFTWDIDESPPAIDHLAKRVLHDVYSIDRYIGESLFSITVEF